MDLSLTFVLPHWVYWGGLALLPLLLILGAGWRELPAAPAETGATDAAGRLLRMAPGNRFTRWVDALSQLSGTLVAYWTVIAVFVYFYEVVARYFLRSPTNWAHESMFLMFGMQYVLAGAYAYYHDAHVRVDLVYSALSQRKQAAIDIITFFAFLIFCLAFLWTGWTFFSSSMNQQQFFFASGYSNEVSFTEWAIAYYPVKFTLVLGAVLLLLQGLSRLIKDLQILHLTGPEPGRSGLIPWTATGFLVALLSLCLGAVILVEVINIAFYDPYGEARFLYSLQGVLNDVAIDELSVLMFGSLLLLLFAGLPLAFVTGSLGVLFIYLVGDQFMLNIIPTRIFPLMTNYQLSAIPLFIFMASMLERAGLIDEMFDVLYKWMGGLRGGLAMATVIASTILAAMVGVIGAAVVTMGIIALPAMLKRNYEPKIAIGSIMAGGTLGILIPPSILAIIYAVVAQQSVGELYVGSILPGLLLSGMYVLYVGLRTLVNPALGPALPEEERIGLMQKLLLLRSMAAPVILIALVLGVIFSGAATPVEAAGIGSFGAMVVAALHGRLSLTTIAQACVGTAKATAMVLWIIFGATVFVGFYILRGGQDFVSQLILGSGIGPYGILGLMMLILVFLGMFLDWVGILLLAVPIFIPIINSLDFAGLLGLPGVAPADVALWFGVLYLINMQMSFLSPPFGYALFYLRGVAPKSIATGTIFLSALPFLVLQAVGLLVCIVFPEVILALPRLVYG